MEGERLAAPPMAESRSAPAPSAAALSSRPGKLTVARRGRSRAGDFVDLEAGLGKRLSENQARQPLTKGRTGQMKGFKSKPANPIPPR